MRKAVAKLVRDWFIVADGNDDTWTLYESDEKETALSHASRMRGVLHRVQSIEIDDFRNRTCNACGAA